MPVRTLPSRPLRVADVADLASDDRFDVAPYGGHREDGELCVYALKLAVKGTAYALGYDESAGAWTKLASADAADPREADAALDPALDGWALDRYGDRFEVVKTL